MTTTMKAFGLTEERRQVDIDMSMETKIRIGLQAALNGWIGPETLAVTVGWSRESVRVRVFSDNVVGQDLADALRKDVLLCLTPTIDPKYTGDPTIAVEFLYSEEPERIKLDEGVVVFCRRGTLIT